MSWRRLMVFAAAALVGTVAWVAYPPPARTVEFPNGKKFALTIVDDTDQTTLERIRPIYDLLHEAGMRTTKTVWVYEHSDDWNLTNRGESLTDAEYREFIVELQSKGFEIALHGVRGGSSPRQDIIDGLEEYRRTLGEYPRLHVNHSLNQENLYWGQHRWSIPVLRWAFAKLRSYDFSGHEPTSPHFWGDVARERISYVRRFTYHDINVLRVNPSIPYRLAHAPYVNYWFEAVDGGSIDAFDRLLSPVNLDRLERENGVTFVYAHLGAGSFNKGDGLDERLTSRIKDLSSRDGWYAPASEILDHLAKEPGWRPELSLRERLRLELLALFAIVFRGGDT